MSKQIGFDRLFDAQSFDKGTNDLVKYLNRITDEINKAKDSATEFAKIMGAQLKTEIAQLSSTSANLAKKMQDITQKMNDFKVATSNTKKVISDYEKENEKLRKELENLKKAQQDVTNTTKNKSQVMGQLRQSLLGAAAGGAILYRGIQMLGQQLSLAVTSTLDFEKAMKEVQAISRASSAELAALTENANRLGATTEKTAGDIARLQKELAKLGFNPTEIIASTDAIVDLSTATGEDLANSATVAAATLRAFGLEATEMNRVVDVMTGSFVRSGLDLEKFRESMKLVAPIARATGVDIEATTAALSKLADAGLSGSLAGTALRNLLSSMADPSEKLTKFLGKLNGELADGVKSSDDLVLAFKELKKSGIDLATAVQMVDVRARPAFFTLLNQAEAVEALAAEYRILDGESQRIADTMRDTLSNDIEIASSAFDAMRRNVIEEFTPSLRQATQAVTTFSEAFRFLFKDVAESTREGGILDLIFYGTGGADENSMITPIVKALAFAREVLDGYVEASTFLEQVDELRGRLEESNSNFLNSYVKDLSAISGLNDMIAKGTDGNVKAYDEIGNILNGFGDQYKDIEYQIKQGLTTEQATFLLKDRILKSLKNQVQVYDQNSNALDKINKRVAYLNSLGNLTKEQQNELNLLKVKQTDLDMFINANTARYLKIKEAVKKEQIEINDTVTDTTDQENEAKKILEEKLKLQHKLREEYQKGIIDQLKAQEKLEKDPYKKLKLLEQIGVEEANLAKLRYTNELEILDQLYKDDANYLLKRKLAYQEYINEANKVLSDFAIDFSKQSDKLVEDSANNMADIAKQRGKAILDAQVEEKKQRDNDNQDKIKSDKETWDIRLELAQLAAEALSNITRSVFDNRQIQRDNELNKIDEWEQEKLRLAGDNEEAKLAIQQKAEEQRREIAKKQAQDNKKEAMFQIAISTAVAVMRTLEKGAGFFSTPLAIAVAALGAAQLAMVAARPLPQFAKGTNDSPEGFAEVGERGRELIRDGRTGQWSLTPDKSTVTYLSKHSQVIPNAQTEQILKADPNIMADNYLKNKIIEVKAPQIDYTKIGEAVGKELKNIPINMTNFDERGVTNYVVKRSVRLQRLNKRY